MSYERDHAELAYDIASELALENLLKRKTASVQMAVLILIERAINRASVRELLGLQAINEIDFTDMLNDQCRFLAAQVDRFKSQGDAGQFAICASLPGVPLSPIYWLSFSTIVRLTEELRDNLTKCNKLSPPKRPKRPKTTAQRKKERALDKKIINGVLGKQ